MTPWVMRLIFANVIVFLLQRSNPGLTVLLEFRPISLLGQPWTVVTYMFAHASWSHIFFNMLSLFFFGPRIEQRLGGRRFLGLYFSAGAMGALVSAINPLVGIIGASGAVFGIMYGFARYWPREKIYLWGILGVESRILVTVMAAASLWMGLSGGGGNIAHFAHLGGFAGGWLYLHWIESHSPAAKWKAKVTAAARPPGGGNVEKWRTIDLTALHPVNREEAERVLAKLKDGGAAILSPGEIEFLERFSAR